jgi:hypothetical protein
MTKLTSAVIHNGLLNELLKHQPHKVIELSRSANPIVFTHGKRLASIIAALSFLFVGLWFAVSTYLVPQPSYPYYDTHRPVPPWSEPAPLDGNRDRGGE